jgi:hypothetical protein
MAASSSEDASTARRNGEQGERTKLESINQAVDKRISKLRRALSGFGILPIMLPIPSITWWHQYLLLQPDCSIREAFDDDYLAMLHSALSTSYDESSQHIEEKDSLMTQFSFSLSPSPPPRAEGTSESDDSVEKREIQPKGGESSPPGDPLYTLVRVLQSNTHRPIVIIDGMDVTILIALWEYFRRKALPGSTVHDISISASFYPSTGISVMQFQSFMQRKFKILSPIAWENLLVCFPFAINAGLPPLLMLQYHYKENPIGVLAGAVIEAASPILCTDKDGEFVLDLVPLIVIVSHLCNLEQSYVQAINECCKKRLDEAHLRDFSSIEQVGWKQFRLYYYHTATEESLSTIVTKRVVSYLSGILQLASVYRGKISNHHLISQIKMDDAPLVSDLLVILQKLVKAGQYIGLPDTYDSYCQEATQKRRTLNRLWPLFLQKLSG